MRNIYWIGLIIVLVILPFFSYLNNSVEEFGGGGHGGGRGGGGRGGGGWHGGGRGGYGRGGWHGGYGHGGRRYYGGYGGGGGYYNYYPSWYSYPAVWYNNWFGSGCKSGCTKIKDGMWGCTNPGNNPGDCYFASDCYYCGN